MSVVGGGRYPILLLPSLRQLAVFDGSEAKIVKRLLVAVEDVKVAADMDQLLIVQPSDKTMLRYSLTSFKCEVATQATMKAPRSPLR